jgi:hypothetical protein
MDSDIQIAHFKCDGKQRCFVVDKVHRMIAILLDGEPIPFGIKGLDTNRFAYWSEKCETIMCDCRRAPPEDGAELTIIYYPYVEWTVLFQGIVHESGHVIEDILKRLDALEADRIATVKIDGNDIARQVISKLRRSEAAF